MVNIDYIMELLDWNNDSKKQQIGIELAQEVKCINVFLQPGAPYGKTVWLNCAKVLAAKPDKELEPYLVDLLEWLQDMNWPGAHCVLERLQHFENRSLLGAIVNGCIVRSRLLNDEIWENNLATLVRDP